MRQRADESVRIIGVPKTIDNELNDTNHAPGYGSAAKFVAAALGDIYCDSGV